MLTNTLISSYIIPKQIWYDGIPGNNQIVAIAIPARDALEIERRRKNNINLRNEDHRYTICCERIQSLAAETQRASTLMPSPVIWDAVQMNKTKNATAAAYLIMMEVFYKALNKSLDKLPYQRFLAVFIPPEDGQHYLQLMEWLNSMTKLDDLLQRATNISSRMGEDFVVSTQDCRLALTQRLELIRFVHSGNYGLVDVIDIV
jgi:hypothetical protein